MNLTLILLSIILIILIGFSFLTIRIIVNISEKLDKVSKELSRISQFYE